MDSQEKTSVPVPFSVEELPQSLQSVVREALRDPLDSQEAFQAIEDYWAEEGERTAPLILAYAYLRVIDAREVMVEREMEEADRALELCEEARRLGLDDADRVGDFEQTCREVFGEAKERRDYWYKMGGFDPSELHDEELLPVARELFAREEYERAVPFFHRALDLDADAPTEDWLDFARSLEEIGGDREARDIYSRLISQRDEIDETIALTAYAQLVLSAPEDAIPDLSREAREWAETLDATWPWGYESQEALLELALDLEEAELASHVARVIEAREGSISRDVRDQVEEARRRYNG